MWARTQDTGDIGVLGTGKFWRPLDSKTFPSFLSVASKIALFFFLPFYFGYSVLCLRCVDTSKLTTDAAPYNLCVTFCLVTPTFVIKSFFCLSLKLGHSDFYFHFPCGLIGDVESTLLYPSSGNFLDVARTWGAVLLSYSYGVCAGGHLYMLAGLWVIRWLEHENSFVRGTGSAGLNTEV